MKGACLTLFTSVKPKIKRSLMRQCVFSLLISIFLVVFNAVYTHFSSGEYSLYMRYSFLFPLIMTFILPLIIILLGKCDKTSRLGYNLYNASCASFVVGCTVKGIIEISGRITSCERIYFGLGLFLAAGSVISTVFDKKNQKTT